MRNLIVLIVCLISLSSTFAQQKTSSKKLDMMIEAGMEDWQIPGLSAVVVKDGEVVFHESYGIRNLETERPVDKNTLFAMASTTKAIVAMSLGILVDRGKIHWDDKVVEYLPAFRLSDPYITADARVKDLLTHNLGIGSADLLWVLDSLSTAETIKKFEQAKTAYPLRGGFVYQNIMYAIAGELIEAVSGRHWTTFVEENILLPLEMSHTQTKSNSIFEAGNFTAPHYNNPEEGIIQIDYTFTDQIGPAGILWSCTNDISKYLAFIVNQGVFKKDTVLQLKTFNYLFKPQTILTERGYPTNELSKPNWNTYGLGWFQQDYRGSKLDFHTGSLPGLIALAGVMLEHNLAIYVFGNLDHAELRHAIMYKAIDLYIFNDDSRDWHQDIFELYSRLKEEEIQQSEKRDEDRIQGTSPSLDLQAYEGIYENETFGDITVSLVNKQLQLDINHFLLYKAEHWHYNTFITNKDPKWQEKFLINFDLDQSGKINELELFGERFIKHSNDLEK